MLKLCEDTVLGMQEYCLVKKPVSLFGHVLFFYCFFLMAILFMQLTEIIQALVLGVVEGVTEFIPVSSTGHLILLVDFIGFNAVPGKAFEVIIQTGAICSILWLYRKKFISVLATYNSSKEAARFVHNIIVAFIPTAIAGVLLYGFIKNVLFSPLVVSLALIIGGVLIIIIEKLPLSARYNSTEQMPLKISFYIGICQILSMMPGVSRSGATIMGALLLGADRKTATEFSFFLAIPTMFGAAVFDIYKNYASLSFDNVVVIIIGFITAFLSALIVVKAFVKFVGSHGFIPFAWYRIIFGLLMLAFIL